MEPRSLQYISDACKGRLSNGSADSLARGISTDSRKSGPGDVFFAISGERFDGHIFVANVARNGAAAVVVQAGKIPETFKSCPVIEVEDSPRLALGRLAARYRMDFKIPVIAVCGSNGKTTTKELVASVLRQVGSTLWNEGSYNNDVGVPLTLLRLEGKHWAAVVESGTNHPGELQSLLGLINPGMGLITNIGREHLEYFKDLEGVAREEGAIAQALPSNGVLFVNGDCALSESIAKQAHCRVVRVGLGKQNEYQAGHVRFFEKGVEFEVTCPKTGMNGTYQIKLLGRHQAVNALFAVAVGTELGLSREQVQRGLAECEAPKMRLQLWNVKGFQIIDDCYNANTDSMNASLETLREMPCLGRRVAVLGDMGEQGECSLKAHLEIGQRVASGGVDQLFVIGHLATQIAAAAREKGMSRVSEFPDVEHATKEVSSFVRPGDLVLIKASRSMRLERISECLKNGMTTSGK